MHTSTDKKNQSTTNGSGCTWNVQWSQLLLLFSKKDRKIDHSGFFSERNVVNNGLGSVWNILYIVCSQKIWTTGNIASPLKMLHKLQWVMKCIFPNMLSKLENDKTAASYELFPLHCSVYIWESENLVNSRVMYLILQIVPQFVC